MNRSALPVLSSCLLLAACATTTEGGRTRVMAPTEVGTVYSEVEVQTRLALTPDVNCRDSACPEAEAFRLRVQEMGERLGDAAYKVALEMNLPPPRFNIVVPGKEDIGTLSTAAGNIIVFDGLRELDFCDPALAFLIAREMGHILAQHHEENSATNIGISLAVTLFFPMANLLRGAEAAFAAASTTSLATSAASFAGARIVKGIYRSDQQREADLIALRILAPFGWTPFVLVHALEPVVPESGAEGWLEELQESRHWLDRLAVGPLPLPTEVVAEVVSPPAEDVPVVIMPEPLPLADSFSMLPVRVSLPVVDKAQAKPSRTCKTRIVRGVKKTVCKAMSAKQKKPRRCEPPRQCRSAPVRPPAKRDGSRR